MKELIIRDIIKELEESAKNYLKQNVHDDAGRDENA